MPVRTLIVLNAAEITLSLVSVSVSLSNRLSATLAAVASKMKLRISAPVTPVVFSLRLRLLNPAAVSTTRTENSSVPAPALPLKVIAAALMALIENRLSAPSPVAVIAKADPALTSTRLLAKSATCWTAVIPSRLKLAVPLGVSATLISPVAVPLKLTTPLFSTTEKVVSTTSLTAMVMFSLVLEPSELVATTVMV